MVHTSDKGSTLVWPWFTKGNQGWNPVWCPWFTERKILKATMVYWLLVKFNSLGSDQGFLAHSVRLICLLILSNVFGATELTEYSHQLFRVIVPTCVWNKLHITYVYFKGEICEPDTLQPTPSKSSYRNLYSSGWLFKRVLQHPRSSSRRHQKQKCPG